MGGLLVAFGKTMRAAYKVVNRVQKATAPIRKAAAELRRITDFARNPYSAIAGEAVNKVLGGSIKQFTDDLVDGVLTGLDLNGQDLKMAERAVDAMISGNSPMFESAIDDIINTLDTKDDSGIGARQSLLNLSESLTNLFEAVDTPRQIIKAVRGDQSAITKLIGDGKIARQIKDFRVPMKDGRIVGIHGKKYLLLSFLNEFLNPREEGARIEAYYELPIAERNGNVVELKGATTLERGMVENAKIGEVIAAIQKNARYSKKFDKLSVEEASKDLSARLNMTKLADLELMRVKSKIQQHAKDFAAGATDAEEFRYRVNRDLRKLFLSLELLAVGGLGNLSEEAITGIHKRSATTMRSLGDYIDKTIEAMAQKRGGDPDAGTPVPSSRGAAGFEKFWRDEGNQVFGWKQSDYVSDSVRDMFTDGYVEKLGDRAVGPAFERSQAAYREILGEISDESQEAIYEVRRLEDGVENCPFCIEVADDPQPVGVLPPIGDGNCYNIKYHGGFCYCKMDVATDEEINSVTENANALAQTKAEAVEGEEG